MAEEEKNQEELAKEWEEALKEQEKEGNSEEDIMAAWQEALKEQESSSTKEEKEAETEREEDSYESKFELLKDIPLEVMVEIGSTKLPLEEILNLHANSVIELDRLINEPVDIKINGKLVAKGKLYVVEDSYGVEITQIITPEERLKLIEED